MIEAGFGPTFQRNRALMTGESSPSLLGCVDARAPTVSEFPRHSVAETPTRRSFPDTASEFLRHCRSFSDASEFLRRCVGETPTVSMLGRRQTWERGCLPEGKLGPEHNGVEATPYRPADLRRSRIPSLPPTIRRNGGLGYRHVASIPRTVPLGRWPFHAPLRSPHWYCGRVSYLAVVGVRGLPDSGTIGCAGRDGFPPTPRGAPWRIGATCLTGRGEILTHNVELHRTARKVVPKAASLLLGGLDSSLEAQLREALLLSPGGAYQDFLFSHAQQC